MKQNRGSSVSFLNTVSNVCCATGLTRFFEGTQGTRWMTFLHFQLTPTVRRMARDSWTMESLGAALQVIKDHYHVLPMDEAVGYVKGRREFPESSVVLTTSLTMLPEGINLPEVLDRHNVPMTVYLSPGLLNRGALPWPLTIRWGLEKVQNRTVDLCGRRWLLNNADTRKAACLDATERLYRLPEPDRQEQVEAIMDEWGLDSLDFPGLTWNEAAEFARCNYITLGATGHTGDSLVRLPLDRIVCELREARRAFEEHLGRPLKHVEYPWGDASALVTSELRAQKCESGVALYERMRGMNPPETSPFELTSRTLHVGGDKLLRTDLSGLFDFLPFVNDARGGNDTIGVSVAPASIATAAGPARLQGGFSTTR